MSKFLITYHGSGMPDDPAIMEQAKAAFGAGWPAPETRSSTRARRCRW